MMAFASAQMLLLGSLLLGLGLGFLQLAPVELLAQAISGLFMNFLKLLAGPIVFLAIFSTLMNMKNIHEMRGLAAKVFKYTLLTTIAATFVALSLFLIINPINSSAGIQEAIQATLQESYFAFLMQIVPSNFVGAFLENNVLAIAFLGFILGFASLKLPDDERLVLSQFFNVLFKLMLKLAQFVIWIMPVGIWAFSVLLVKDLISDDSFFRIFKYLLVVFGANLIQGVVVLPLFLKWKGISPVFVFKNVTRALVLAFFSKSSNATLPVALECAQTNLGVSEKVSRFSLPLCTVINMNGCAAFILTTVLFVAGSNGHIFSLADYAMWVILATIAAIGNAGVPMGCFFLSSAFLIAMQVPLELMGLILPFYALLDMLETALNVWSDLCVTQVVDKEYH